MSRPPDDPLAHAVGQVVSEDEELQRRLRNLLKLVIGRAERDMMIGTPSIQANLMGKLIPSAMKVLGEEQANDELAVMRAEFMELQAEVRRDIADPRAEVTDDGLTEDTRHHTPPPIPDTLIRAQHPQRGDGKSHPAELRVVGGKRES